MPGDFHEPLQWCQCPGNHGIKAMAGCIVLTPAFNSNYVVEAQQSGHVLDEHDLLVVAVEQGKFSIRLYNRERQPRKSRAGTNIQYLPTMQQWPRCQAVENVRRDHFVTVPDCRQVDPAVPLFQLIQQRLEPCYRSIVDSLLQSIELRFHRSGNVAGT